MLKQKKPLIRKTALRQKKPMARGHGFRPPPKLALVVINPEDETAPPSRQKAPRARRKIKPGKPQPTAAESAYMGRVAALGCIVCSHCFGIHGTPAIVHHLRTGQGKMRAGHYETLPLCSFHHQDSGEGVHDMGRRQFEVKYGISELGLLHLVQTKLGVPLWQPTLLSAPSLNGVRLA